MAKTQGKELEIVWSKREKTLLKEGKPLLKYRMELPILRNDQRAARRINRCYTRAMEVWERRWTEACRMMAEQELEQCREKGSPFRPWEAELTGTVTWMDGARFSVRMEAGERRGDGRTSRVCWGDIWELKEGAPCPVEQVTDQSRKELRAELLRQGRELARSGLCFLDRDWERKAEKLLGTLSPCLTEQGLEYSFPQASIAPAAEGVLRFTVSCT